MSLSKLVFKEKIELFNLDGINCARTQNSQGEIFWDSVNPEMSYRYNTNQGWQVKTKLIGWVSSELPYPEEEYQKL